MRVVPVPEQDSSWERVDARYRLYTFREGGATSTHDIVDATLRDALEAGEIAGRSGRLWSLALVVDDSVFGRGLAWLSGMDHNDGASTPAEWRARAEMQDRYLAAVARTSDPPTLPDGRRVIRLFCDHGVDWPLWESFTAEYTRTPDELGLSASLRDRLHAWNEDYQRESVGPQWREEGLRLHALLQDEVASFAEVRPDFGHPND